MSGHLAHKTRKELKEIRDTPLLRNIPSSRNAGGTHEPAMHTLKNNPSIDQIEAVAELRKRRMQDFTIGIGLFMAVLAVITLWPRIREWIQSSPPVNTTVVSQPTQSYSLPSLQTKSKKSISQGVQNKPISTKQQSVEDKSK
jgi:hypothetical protein